MKQSDILFSVIIPLYNKEKCIKDTIFSVLSQTYANFEIIVVDDGSTDNSATNVKSINDYRIKYYYKDNGGVSSARNYGISKAKGGWILLLDADDTLRKNAFEKFYNVLITYKGHLDIITGNSVIVKSGKEYLHERTYCGVVPNNYKWYFFDKFSIRTGCTVIRKELLYDNLFNESLSRYEDLEFFLRLLKKTVVYVLPDVIFEYKCDNNFLSKVTLHSKDSDFIYSIDFRGKDYWEKCKLGELLMLALIDYPEDRKKLILKYKYYVFFIIVAKIKTSFSKRKWKKLMFLFKTFKNYYFCYKHNML